MKGKDLLLAYLEDEDVSPLLVSALREHLISGISMDKILGLNENNLSPRRAALLQARGQLLLKGYLRIRERNPDLSDRQCVHLLFDALQAGTTEKHLNNIVSKANLYGAMLNLKLSNPDSLYNAIIKLLSQQV